MIGFSNVAKDAMLGCFTDQPLTVGLFDGEQEIQDPRYERQPIEFGAPEDDGAVRVIENTSEVLFPDMGRDHTVDHWGVFNGAGELLALFRLVEPRDMPAEDRARFKPGNLSIGMP